MELRDITCCFSGHRPMKLPWGLRESDSRCCDTKKWIAAQIEELYGSGYRRFMCGMAIGCDMYFAEAVIGLKAVHGDVILFGAIPCSDQADHWNRKQRLMYSELVAQCDEVKVFSPSYTLECMNKRNMFMVNESSALVACFDGMPGGTMNTIAYAQRNGLDVRILDVSSLVRDELREGPPDIIPEK